MDSVRFHIGLSVAPIVGRRKWVPGSGRRQGLCDKPLFILFQEARVLIKMACILSLAPLNMVAVLQL